MNRIMKIAEDLILSSTCHGIPNIIRAKKNYFLIIMWSISVLVCSGYLFYLTLSLIGSYLNYPVITSIDVFNESPTLFPTVTFCNLNDYSHKDLLNATLISCRLNNRICNKSDFSQVTINAYGTCLRFNDNLERIQKTYVAGKYSGGLILELFA